jgi:hypothetical protein
VRKRRVPRRRCGAVRDAMIDVLREEGDFLQVTGRLSNPSEALALRGSTKLAGVAHKQHVAVGTLNHVF